MVNIVKNMSLQVEGQSICGALSLMKQQGVYRFLKCFAFQRLDSRLVIGAPTNNDKGN
jgi:hypothetical protein